MRIALTTLGCKINQFETDVLRQELETQGNTIVPFQDDADVYVINTCSVTARSDHQCRQMIRTAVRRGKGSKVVVTGCYAETRPAEIRSIPGVDQVIGNRDKGTIAATIMSMGPPAQAAAMTADTTSRAVNTKTRGFLKIQDGCDNQCTYCIVPLARGRSRSVLPGDVVREFERKVQEGVSEVVLTGIHIGRYGADLEMPSSLTELVQGLLSRRAQARIRISSIEPQEITDGLTALIGHGLCRHLHIPLQSGDDAILSSMNRNYTSGFYRKLIFRLADLVPQLAIGADVMVGFPGEGDAEFQNTVKLIEQAPLTHLHVFSYSPRPGTSAADMRVQVPETVIKERREVLRRLGREKNHLFRHKCLGSEFNVIVEDKIDKHTGQWTGLTDNYIRMQIKGLSDGQIGKEVRVLFNDIDNDANFAIIK